MENRSVKSTQPEQLEQWVNNAVVSLSASLVFGREKASQIAQPLLLALFTLTSNDFKKALEIIVSINDFSVKRIFLEQFKYCYIVNTGSEELSALVTNVDFSSKQMSDKYDTVLLKLFNENDKDFALLSETLGALPIKAKRVALKRLQSKEFQHFKRVKVRAKWPLDQGRRPLIKTWHWILVFIGIAAVVLTQTN
ncbi:hypothetical protein OBB02_04550 [Candidatus Puniceispirillum sp.]|nr:hypothetical protein [Candidatus Puniceispirillum sp.]